MPIAASTGASSRDDAAVADDADRAAGKLPADLDLGLAALVIGRRRARDAAREIDQEADGQLDHRFHEARLGVGHQHPRFRCRRDVDVADVDGAPHHDLEPGQALEDHGRHRRRAIGDDEVDVPRRGDHALPDRAARRPRAASPRPALEGARAPARRSIAGAPGARGSAVALHCLACLTWRISASWPRRISSASRSLSSRPSSLTWFSSTSSASPMRPIWRP